MGTDSRSEAEILAEARVLISAIPGCSVFRNSIGAYKTPAGGYIKYGLAEGSPDLIVAHSVIVTPEMVGQKVLLMKGVETKTAKGKLRKAQENFRQFFESRGGKYVVWRGKESIENLLGNHV